MGKLAKAKELYKKRGTLKRQCRWMAAKTKPYLPQLILLVVLEMAMLAVSMACTLINKQLIDKAQPASGPRVFDAGGLAVLVVLSLVSIAVGAFSTIMSTLIREKYTTGVRADMFHRVVHSRWAALNAYHSEDTVTRLTSDVDSVASGIADLFPNVIYLFAELITAFVILSIYDIYLALAALALGPLCVLAGWMFSGKLKKFETALKENNSAYRAFMQESISNVTVLKAFEQEDISDKRLLEIRAERLELVKKRNYFSTFIHSVMGILFRGGYLLAFGWGIFQIARGNITYGTMSVFLSLVSRVQSPVMNLSNVLTSFVDILASAGRVMELEDMPAEPPQDAAPLRGMVGVRLRDVTFGYTDSVVLDHVNIDIAPGRCIGLVGESGIGKTTAARLILALVSPSEGEVIFYDDAGHEYPAGVATRRFVSYVPQGNTLASGTIRANLLTGDPFATEEDMWQVLAAAGADEFVRAQKDGLDARLGERGIGISEGQAQRIAIARALIRKNSVLILDEATASLDVDTESLIMNNLKSICRGHTCLVITHRPSLLEMCDDVVRLA